jgi:tetratricopeptide (TPR) repeat protein
MRAFRACAAALALACAGAPKLDERHQPAGSVLEVIAVLQQHVPDDTYRFPPARDFTGRNVYRSSLLRLENLESLHADGLRAGHLDGAIAFAKARALERLRAYDVAAEAYRIAAEREPELKEEALRSAAICDGLSEAIAFGVDLKRDDAKRDEAWLQLAAPTMVLGRFEQRGARLDALLAQAGTSHQAVIVREEIERSDMERARYFTELRHTLPDGDVQAVAELRRISERHADSKNAPRHLLALADLYVDLAMEYAERHPPEGMLFDPAEFQDLVDSGARIYEMVAARDGTPERIEASRRLEAFLAFSIAIDRERFTP